MCYRTYFLLVVASHVHMNCLQDVNVIYTLRKNVFTQKEHLCIEQKIIYSNELQSYIYSTSWQDNMELQMFETILFS